jgi:DNA polymerase III gamma/tau subunit
LVRVADKVLPFGITPKSLKMSIASLSATISTFSQQDLKKLNKEIHALMKASPKDKRLNPWFAFMAHCRDTMPERFVNCKGGPARAVVCSEIRKEDEVAYTTFAKKFNAENSASASDSDSSAKVLVENESVKSATNSAEKEAKPTAKSAEKEAKAAAKSAEKEAKAAAKSAEKQAKAEAKTAEKEAKAAAKTAEKQAKAAAKTAEKQAKAARRVIKSSTNGVNSTKKQTPVDSVSTSATPGIQEDFQEDVMPKITINGTAYWHDESSNGLYGIDLSTNGISHWVGFFQPHNEAEPIRYTASEGDDE